jgi:hypothetical protein
MAVQALIPSHTQHPKVFRTFYDNVILLAMGGEVLL